MNLGASNSARLLILLVLGFAASSCDRGAGEQINVAKKFAHAVVSNDEKQIDSMVATARFKQHFDNQFTRAEMIQWFRSFYDFGTKKFKSKASADVDDKFAEDLAGGMLRPGEIEETGKVRVRSTIPGQFDAYFWMVKQKDRPWGVAMVTKGEMKVHFK